MTNHKYKAILYETPVICEFLYIPEAKAKELNKPKPVDSVLLDKKCYKTAEGIFFGSRNWDRDAKLHIEIEEEPRILA
jgi:hypothetical protein